MPADPTNTPTSDDEDIVNYEDVGYWTTFEHVSNHDWGAGSTVSYAFDPASAWTSTEMAAFAEGLQLWSDVANIQFVQVSDYSTAGIEITRGSDGQADTNDFVFGGQLTRLARAVTSIDTSQPYWTDLYSLGSQDSTNNGGYGFLTVIHELGHAIGLGHADGYNAVAGQTDYYAPGEFAHDSQQYTVMSYVAVSQIPGNAANYTVNTPAGAIAQVPSTPMIDDILAVQAMYGANTSTRDGDTVYGFNSTAGEREYDFTQNQYPVIAIWDGGGNNTLDLSGFTANSTVDLDPGSFSSADNMIDNLSIAFNTWIDNAIGGTGDDIFTVNSQSDTIDGGAGNNTVVLPNARSAYSYARSGATITLTDTSSGSVYTLDNIQQFAFSNETLAAVALGTATWTGTSDNDFGNAANWDDGAVPGAINEVAINIATPARIDNTDTTEVDSVQIGARGTLQVDSGDFIIDNAGTSSSNSGQLDIDAVGTQVSLHLSGSFQNNGLIDLVGPDAALIADSSTVTIGGAGTIAMTRGNIGGRSSSPLDTLITTNVIDGSGLIGLDGIINSITLVNQGTISATDVLPLTLTGDVVNRGVLDGASAGVSLVLIGTVDNSAGTIAAQAGDSVQFGSVTVSGGTIAGPGTLEVTANSTLDGSTMPITLGGDMTVDPGVSLVVTGTVSGGTIDASKGSVKLDGASLSSGVKLVGANFSLGAGSTIYAASDFDPPASFDDGLTINGGGIELAPNQTDGANGFLNPKTIKLTGKNASLIIDEIVSISGGGTIALTDPTDTIAGGGGGLFQSYDEFVNADNTITGVGRIVNIQLDNLGTGTIIANGGTLILSTGTQTLNYDGFAVREEIYSDGWVGAAPGSDLVIIGGLNLGDNALFGIPGPAVLGNTGTITLGGNDGFVTATGLLEYGTIPAGVDFEIAPPGGELSADVENDSSITVQGDATLRVSETLTNVGSIALAGYFDGTLHHGATLAPDGDTTFNGSGTITLRDSADTITSISNMDTLENADNTIAGAGQLGAGSLNLVNSGTIDADMSGAALVISPGAGTFISTGLMEATNGGTLVLDGTLWSGISDVPIIAGLGTIAASGGGVVQLDSGSLTDGVLTSTGGTFEVTGNIKLIGDPEATGYSVTNGTALHVLAGNTVTLHDSLINTQLVSLEGANTSLLMDGTVDLGGSGTITLGGTGNSIGGAGSADGLENDNNTIQGSGSIGGANFGFINSGTVNATTGTLAVNTGTKLVTNQGLMEATAGALNVAGEIDNDAEIESRGGTVTLGGGVIGFGFLQISGGEISVNGSVSLSQNVYFDPAAAGELRLGDPAETSAFVTGFFQSDTIDFAGINASTFNYDSGEDELTLMSGSTTLASVGLQGVAYDGTLHLAPSSDGTAISLLCFCANTMILTPTGERPVQDLAAGDMVTTQGGAARRIEWIGVGQVLATRGRRTAATPVIVRRGALADNVPHRDLRLTKGHALYLDGALIPVEFLVNHRSIEWDDRAQEVEVYHIELATHDVLIADGAAAESYRDDGNRWLFRNANPGWQGASCEPYAPVLTGGVLVDAVWRRLLDRAGPRPGRQTTDEPDLHLLADGTRVDAMSMHGGAYVFALPRPPRELRIISRAAAPDQLGIARDSRVLGVALRRIALRQGSRFRVVKAQEACFADGYHRFEPSTGLRWTDGDAALPSTALEGYLGPFELVLHVGCTGTYRLEGEARAAA